MQTANRTTIWVAIVVSLILAFPAAAFESVPDDRYSIAQRRDRDHDDRRRPDHRPDRRPDRRHGPDELDAAAGFLGLFLGLLGGLSQQGAPAAPSCDPGAVQGWLQLHNGAFDFVFNYPSHWQQVAVNDPNVLHAVVNPCPPNPAVIVARSPVTRLLSQQELEIVMYTFQKEGNVFTNLHSQAELAMPGRMRRQGVFSGVADGVEMAALVHLVSAPSGLFIVVGLVPSAAGEQAGVIVRSAVESFTPAAAFAPGG